ncbi:F-box domain-containing protein [Diplocarpon rosae]|nr:F-box domain-containing protein [Diplocarpon rosae]
MTANMEETNTELEQFRQQWRAEVSARSQADGNRESKSTKLPCRPPRTSGKGSTRASKPLPKLLNDEEEAVQSRGSSTRTWEERRHEESSKALAKEPQSALEHYEKAVEREAAGNLGDSVTLYRKAFRMDDRVDQKYKNKHFPPSYFASKPSNSNLLNPPAVASSTTYHSRDGPQKSTKELLAGFSGLKISPVPPAIEGTPAPPCPIADLPEEILIQVFRELSITDIASFAKLAQVCKRMAYLVATEEQIWKRLCLGSEIGFGAMHYRWQREVLGGPLREEDRDLEGSDGNEAAASPLEHKEITERLYSSLYASSWQRMLRMRPRIRFNGCYISTVNYQRAGQASQSQVTWHSPVHIVTYYRYLRFFRDGTVISLLTTHEPAEVVHHITKELQETHRGGAAAYLPSFFMQHALRGRWRLSSVADNPEVDFNEAEGDLFIETEGVSAKYVYRMKLSLRSAGKGARNNKLVWQGFWNYNLLTDDFGEFTLRNDKAFFFSRVKSYGNGA